MDSFTGGCLCGKVRITAHRPPLPRWFVPLHGLPPIHGALFHGILPVFPRTPVTSKGRNPRLPGPLLLPHCGSSFSVFAPLMRN